MVLNISSNTTYVNGTKSCLNEENDPPFIGILGGLLVILILTANIIVLFAICTYKHVTNRQHNAIIVYLCLSDILIGISLAMYVLGRFIESFYSNMVICTLRIYLFECGTALTILHMFFLCLERFLASIRSSWWRQACGKRRRKVLLTASYILIFAYVGILKSIGEKSEVCFCVYDDYYGPNVVIAYRLMSVLCLPPLAFTFVLYLFTARNLMSRIKKVYPQMIDQGQSPQSSTESNRQKQKIEIKAFKTVGIVVSSLYLTRGPGLVLVAVLSVFTSLYIPRLVLVGISFIAMINSFLNPIINRWRIKELKIAIQNITRCKC